MAKTIDLSILEALVKSSELSWLGAKLAIVTAAVVFGLLIAYEEDARKTLGAEANPRFDTLPQSAPTQR